MSYCDMGNNLKCITGYKMDPLFGNSFKLSHSGQSTINKKMQAIKR